MERKVDEQVALLCAICLLVVFALANHAYGNYVLLVGSRFPAIRIIARSVLEERFAALAEAELADPRAKGEAAVPATAASGGRPPAVRP